MTFEASYFSETPEGNYHGVFSFVKLGTVPVTTTRYHWSEGFVFWYNQPSKASRLHPFWKIISAGNRAKVPFTLESVRQMLTLHAAFGATHSASQSELHSERSNSSNW